VRSTDPSENSDLGKRMALTVIVPLP